MTSPICRRGTRAHMIWCAVCALVGLVNIAWCDYQCVCNYNVEKPVYSTPTVNGSVIGYMYEFDCKPQAGPTVNVTWLAISYRHKIGYAEKHGQLQIQTCHGEISDEDKLPTLAPATTAADVSSQTPASFIATATSTQPTRTTQSTALLTTTTQSAKIYSTTQKHTSKEPSSTFSTHTALTTKQTQPTITHLPSTPTHTFMTSTQRYAITAHSHTSSAQKPKTTSLRPGTSIQKLTTTTGRPRTRSLKHRTSTQKSRTATGRPTPSLQPPTTAPQIHTTARQIHTTATQIHTTARQIHTTATQIHTTATQIHTTKTLKPTTTAPKANTATANQTTTTLKYRTVKTTQIPRTTTQYPTTTAPKANTATITDTTTTLKHRTATTTTRTPRTPTQYPTTAASKANTATITDTTTTLKHRTATTTTRTPRTTTQYPTTVTAATTGKPTNTHKTTLTSLPTYKPTPTTKLTITTTLLRQTTQSLTTTDTASLTVGQTEDCLELCPIRIQEAAARSSNTILGQFGKNCYEIVRSKFSWSHAESKCQQHGGHLIHIASQQEQNYIYGFLVRHHIDNVWLGLHDRNNEENFEWSSVIYTNWKAGRKNAISHDSEDCVSMTTNMIKGQWDDIQCGARPLEMFLGHAYICQYGNTILCPPDLHQQAAVDGGVVGQYGYSCYEVIPKVNMTWTHAEDTCYTRGGHLAHIDNAQEQSFIQAFLRTHSPLNAVWIGLNDKNSEGVFQWISQNTVNYTNWLPGHSSNHMHRDQKDCVVLIPYKNGQWDDVSCGSSHIDFFGAEMYSGEMHPLLCQYVLPSAPSLVG